MQQDLFEKENIAKAYLKLALPVVMSMMVTLVYNMVDTFFIAKTGNTDLVAGISIVAPVFLLMIAFGDIWGLGGSSLVSRMLGQKRYEDAKKVSAFSFWAAIFWGLFVTIVMLGFRKQILTLLGADAKTWSYASDYYTFLAAGSVPIILGLVPNNLLRTEGLATTVMIGSLIGSFANIILDPICIFSLHMGAAGAAIATVIGNIISDIYYIFAAMRKSKYMKFAIRNFKVPFCDVKGVLSIGIPASITNIMQSFMMTVTNNYLLIYGTTKIAAMGIALKVNTVSVLILVGFAFGGLPLIGYNYGAQNNQRLKETIRFAYLLEGGCALLLTCMMMVFAPSIIQAFMRDAEIIKNGALMLRCLQLSMFFMSIVLVSTCICQAFGKALGALILSISRQGILYFGVIFLMAHFLGYMGILFSQAVSDVLTALIAIVLIRSFWKEFM